MINYIDMHNFFLTLCTRTIKMTKEKISKVRKLNYMLNKFNRYISSV